MKITVASGKGGTGKTTVATSLALSLMMDCGPRSMAERDLQNAPDQAHSADPAPLRSGDHSPLFFLDCDVEAPNAHLFLNPVFERQQEVSILVPQVEDALCTYCGRCAEVCPWHAIAVVGKKVLVFPQLCHGCGSCTLACPESAITEIPNPIGVIESGLARDGIAFAQGVLNIGEPMAVPIISQLKALGTGPITIIDASPGTACPVVESMRGADFCLLVTEPTPFGLHDLRLTVRVTQELGIPAGVLINRDGVGDSGVDDYCRQAGLPVLMRIPLDQRIAEGIARGIALVDIQPEYVGQFQALYAQIVEIVREQN